MRNRSLLNLIYIHKVFDFMHMNLIICIGLYAYAIHNMHIYSIIRIFLFAYAYFYLDMLFCICICIIMCICIICNVTILTMKQYCHTLHSRNVFATHECPCKTPLITKRPSCRYGEFYFEVIKHSNAEIKNPPEFIIN